MSGHVVEFLTFTVQPADQAAWISADERVWTSFLRRQRGFVSKQVWTDRSDPHLVHAVITWADEESWKSIPADELARTDDEMGEWRRPMVMRVFEVASET